MNKKLEAIFVGLLGLIITLYGLQGLLTGKLIATGSSWKTGWQADGSAALVISLAIFFFGIAMMHAAFKNWRS
jgi:divalent metal cation (Fe/Co/Zn/Cd) transporter